MSYAAKDKSSFTKQKNLARSNIKCIYAAAETESSPVILAYISHV